MHLNPLHLHFGSGIAAASTTITTTTSTTTSKTMEWTNDDALELIEQYRHHTELWNRGDPKYKDKLCRFRAWSEIADRFGCSKAEVERKMNVLLTQYRREKHKMLVKMYQGINPNPSKWYAFKRFDFMESGGGSSGGGGVGGSSSGGGLLIGGSNSAPGSSSNGSGLNGHSVSSHSASAAAATVAALSGLSASSFDAAGGISMSPSTSSSHHRRIKNKEMKYFGAMGLNLPMLLANNQPLDSSVWSSVGQYSPPISERNHQLRAVPPLSMSFQSTSQSELSVPTDGARSLFGGSSNSDIAVSPQKPMETCGGSGGDIDDKDDATKKELRPSPMATPAAAATQHASERGGGSESGDVRSEGGGGSGGGGPDVTPSPLTNANTHEAHQLQLRRQQLQHHHHQQQQQHQDELDIKQELVDYFHVPHPPAPPDSHRSFSSAEEMRLLGSAASLNGPMGCDSGDDYAQDLRVGGSSSVAEAGPRRGLDFSHLMMAAATATASGGHSRRRSDESLEEKYTPLNMRKVSTASSTLTTSLGGGAMGPGSATAGHVLMHSLRGSNESLSEDGTTTASGGGQRGGGKSVTSADAASASVAATLYAESLKRDDCDFIGSNVSLKLRSMDRSQRIIAEKLISEVLFYGQFNELDRSARIQPK